MNLLRQCFLGLPDYNLRDYSWPLKIVGLCGMIFIIFHMNSIFSWFSLSTIIRSFWGIIVIFCSIFLYTKRLINTTNYNVGFALSIFFFAFYLSFREEYNIFGYIFGLASDIALFLFILWNTKVIRITYIYFYRFIVITCLLTIVVSICSFAGVLDKLPYYNMPPVEAVHIRNNMSYNVYGFIVTYHNSYFDYVVQRGCGFLCEPGHFSILLGIIWTIERLLNHKGNIIIFCCGLLTLSPNFIIMFTFTETCLIIKNKMFFKALRIFILILICLTTIILLLPLELQEQLQYYFLDKNIIPMFEALSEGGSLDETLNERTSQTGNMLFERFLRSSDILFGTEVNNINFQLADFRGFFLLKGLFGLILLIVSIFQSVTKLRLYQKIPLFFILFVIFIHRTWMFIMLYQIILVYIGRTLILYQSRTKNKDIYENNSGFKSMVKIAYS